MLYQQPILIRNNEVITSTAAVLRNTYLLLSLTLFFSAAIAYFSLVSHASYGAAMMASLASFGLIFLTSALRNSAWGLAAIFGLTGCLGYGLGPMLNHFIQDYQNGTQLIMTALSGTGLVFFASSLFILITKKDLSHLGKFLMVGLIACLCMSLINLFIKMPAIQLAISTSMIFITALLMMYDTSRIVNSGERNYIMATMALFLDIITMFQYMLMLLGAFSGKDRQ